MKWMKSKYKEEKKEKKSGCITFFLFSLFFVFALPLLLLFFSFNSHPSPHSCGLLLLHSILNLQALFFTSCFLYPPPPSVSHLFLPLLFSPSLFLFYILILTSRLSSFSFSFSFHTWPSSSPLLLPLYFFIVLFNGTSTFVGYLMPKPSMEKDSSGTI